jgi:hypothetical protein
MSKSNARNYRMEYDRYQGSDEQKKKRAARNRAHRLLEKALGREIKQDVDHRKPLVKGGSNDLSNLRVRSVHDNRSFARDSHAHMK